MTRLKEYWNNPFGFVDNLDLTFKGNNLNVFQKFRRVRRTAFLVAIVLGLIPWMLFGFDSCIAQPLMLLQRLPDFLVGKISYETWIQVWHDYYGTAMHYSAFLIYGLCFWGLSRHFDKNMGIVKSKNITYAAGLTFLSIGIFEFYWMWSYSYFQNQWWVLTWKMPQLRIILQNLTFLIVGCLSVLYMWVDSYVLNDKGEIVKRLYKFRINKTAIFLVGLCVFGALFWWFYPFPVERFAVELETGETWINSNHFPQTLYTIDLDPTDPVNAGVWFYKGNDLVHLVNTLVKIAFTFTVFYVGRLKSEV